MRILIIDDNEEKSANVAEFIKTRTSDKSDVEFSFANCLSDAVFLTSEHELDLIILDLLMPYMRGGSPQADAGLSLLKFLRRSDAKNAETPIVGLSAFPAELGSAAGEFANNGVLIVEYAEDRSWQPAVGRVVDTALRRLPRNNPLDFLIIVALEEEREAWNHAGLRLKSASVIDGLNVHFVEIEAAPELSGAIVRCRHMGLVSAVLDTATAVKIFAPRIVAMSGICAGYSKEVKLGQLVLASVAWEYQAGKWAADGFKMAPYQIPLRPATRAVAEQAFSTEQFRQTLEVGMPSNTSRPPQFLPLLLAPAASGSAVIADADRLLHVGDQHRKLAAIDMETFGVYYSCHEASVYVDHFFSVKCVVDLADNAKSDDLHSYGSITSARAAAALIARLSIE